MQNMYVYYTYVHNYNFLFGKDKSGKGNYNLKRITRRLAHCVDYSDKKVWQIIQLIKYKEV